MTCDFAMESKPNGFHIEITHDWFQVRTCTNTCQIEISHSLIGNNNF